MDTLPKEPVVPMEVSVNFVGRVTPIAEERVPSPIAFTAEIV